jgi:hypothetical protein
MQGTRGAAADGGLRPATPMPPRPGREILPPADSRRAAGPYRRIVALVRKDPSLLAGAALALVGTAVTVLFSLQPWRSCAEDDTAAGCAMLAGDAAVMAAAVGVTLLGAILMLAGALRRWRSGVR